MLRETFVHLPGIGLETERRLWAQGCATWECLLDSTREYSLGSASRELAMRELHRSIAAFDDRNHQYFARKLRQRNAWRAWPDFKDSCAYLDIETDGTTSDEAVTMVGVYDGREYHCLTKGEDLESFRDLISRYSVIVTFFGTGFDLPVLLKRFPGVVLDQIHIDLCPLLRTVGIQGGLKKIEAAHGIIRSEETAGLTGFDAVKLWRDHVRGRSGALERLTAYNREDVVNLEPLMRIAFEKLREETLRPTSTGLRRSPRRTPSYRFRQASLPRE